MPWLNTPPFSLEEADQRGQDVFEVLVSNWGGSDLQWPPAGSQSLSKSLAGIAIGPQSQVDRCWVSYGLQKPQTNPPASVAGFTNRLRRLSVDSPLIFSQGSTPGAANNPGALNDPVITQAQLGALYVFAMADAPSPITFPYPLVQETTVLPATFTDVNGVVRTMNSGLAGSMTPLLHLLLYLKAPIVYAPIKRAPLQVSGSVSILSPAEKLIAQVPTFGRKTVHLMMVAANTINSYRVGALRGVSQLAAMQEQPVDQTPAGIVAAGVPVIISSCAAGVNVQADYLNIYAASAVDGNAVTFQVTAYD